jgi:hypothetical protein
MKQSLITANAIHVDNQSAPHFTKEQTMIEAICTENQSLSDSTDYCKAIANKKKKKFIPMQKRESLWKTHNLKFKQIADILIDCPKLSPAAFTAYCYMFKQNPCRPSLAEIEQRLGCRKKVVVEVIKELIARKLIVIKEKGAGTRATLYEFILDPNQWDLASNSHALVPRKKGIFKGVASGSHPTQQENLAVPTRPNKGGTNIRLSHKNNYEINLNEREDEGLGLNAGPATGGQRELPLKTLIHGDKNEKIERKVIVKVREGALSSDKIAEMLGNTFKGSLNDLENSTKTASTGL